MKKTGVLNSNISEVIACMGHMDVLTICDAGLPIPATTCRIDLAIHPGLPGLLDVLKAVASELEVEMIIMAEEIRERSPKMEEEIKKLFPDIKVDYIPHEDFKKKCANSRAIIRTGEFTPYANVMLVSGVCF